MERKESSLAAKEETLRKRSSEVEELFAKEQEELEKISGLTSEQAKEYLLKRRGRCKTRHRKAHQGIRSQSKGRS